MYNKVLQLIAGFINACGTAYAILSILRLTPDDIHNVIRIKGIEERDKELLVQRKQVRIGICLVIVAWFFQGLFSFVEVNNAITFVVAMVGMTILITTSVIFVNKTNKKFETVYTEYSRAELKKHGACKDEN